MKKPTKAVPLLHGPYNPPAVRRGDRINCLVRDCEVVVTSWTVAPLSWPRGYPITEKHNRVTATIVDEELARAVRCESARAVRFWWGVGHKTIAKWRRALGVTRQNNEGTKLLVHAAIEKAQVASLSHEFTAEEREVRRQRARTFKPWLSSPPVTYGKEWTAADEALLGTVTDKEAAERTGHTVNAVQIRRRQLGIPPLGAH